MAFIFVTTTQAHDWGKLIRAIHKVETRGKIHVKHGACAGPLQITPSAVRECNIKQKKFHFTLQDRYSMKQSVRMFGIIQKYNNPSNNIEKAIRIWNGGTNYSVKKTNAYYKRVMKAYNKL